ncbi:MAG: hypothetical protein WB626_06185, partial [Bacteroidota bacterium]
IKDIPPVSFPGLSFRPLHGSVGRARAAAAPTDARTPAPMGRCGEGVQAGFDIVPCVSYYYHVNQ